jgi:hypothetical protein
LRRLSSWATLLSCASVVLCFCNTAVSLDMPHTATLPAAVR